MVPRHQGCGFGLRFAAAGAYPPPASIFESAVPRLRATRDDIEAFAGDTLLASPSSASSSSSSSAAAAAAAGGDAAGVPAAELNLRAFEALIAAQGGADNAANPAPAPVSASAAAAAPASLNPAEAKKLRASGGSMRAALRALSAFDKTTCMTIAESDVVSDNAEPFDFVPAVEVRLRLSELPLGLFSSFVNYAFAGLRLLVRRGAVVIAWTSAPLPSVVGRLMYTSFRSAREGALAAAASWAEQIPALLAPGTPANTQLVLPAVLKAAAANAIILDLASPVNALKRVWGLAPALAVSMPMQAAFDLSSSFVTLVATAYIGTLRKYDSHLPRKERAAYRAKIARVVGYSSAALSLVWVRNTFFKDL